MTARQAFEVIRPLSIDANQKASCIDDSFWTWETLEEALIGQTD